MRLRKVLYMRRIFLFFVACLLITTPVFAEESPVVDGALGLKWGDSEEQIKNVAIEKGYDYTISAKTNSRCYELIYSGTVAGYFSVITFSTIDDQLFSIDLLLDAPQNRYLKFLILETRLAEKYGQPTLKKHDSDNQAAFWRLEAPDGNSVFILLKANDKAGLNLSYAYEPLFTEYFAIREQQEREITEKDL
ncbi:hypothetical protein HSX37_09530|uniref:Uncharacterized protein n=1 Tax=Dendrosporobacter quercicolus TaxID=146817 RepID=A0A1G9QJJ8_9FIRM|nr:hypothetical protein [Dendrosporobacter quercicolus]NSL48268.1 hypothetical protein [Dendrosporobacter quercicolus DSM 1736]SDM11222.1 hypothetical protein SAMN04488502_102201 [Dendrosporobacter quercicolus]